MFEWHDKSYLIKLSSLLFCFTFRLNSISFLRTNNKKNCLICFYWVNSIMNLNFYSYLDLYSELWKRSWLPVKLFKPRASHFENGISTVKSLKIFSVSYQLYIAWSIYKHSLVSLQYFLGLTLAQKKLVWGS